MNIDQKTTSVSNFGHNYTISFLNLSTHNIFIFYLHFISRNPFLPQEEEKASKTWHAERDRPNWTVFDNEPTYLTLAAKNYTHTRLW